MSQNLKRCGCFLLISLAAHLVSLHAEIDVGSAAESSIPAPASASPAIKLKRFANTTIHLPKVPGGSGYATDPAFPLLQFAEPVGITSTPGETNRLFIMEKPGSIAVITNLLEPTRTVFLDIT